MNRISRFIENYINKKYFGVPPSNYVANIQAIVKNVLDDTKIVDKKEYADKNRYLYRDLSVFENILCVQAMQHEERGMYFYLSTVSEKDIVTLQILRSIIELKKYKLSSKNVETELHSYIIDELRNQIINVFDIQYIDEKQLQRCINTKSTNIALNTRRGYAKTLLLHPDTIKKLTFEDLTSKLNFNYETGFVGNYQIGNLFYDIYYLTLMNVDEIILCYIGLNHVDGGAILAPYILLDEENNTQFKLEIFDQRYYNLIKLL